MMEMIGLFETAKALLNASHLPGHSNTIGEAIT